jgi:DNA (cytosine-5)-methyltransferase 1
VLASRTEDPRDVLLSDDAGELSPRHGFRDDNAKLPSSIACGFYWTEGTRGLGWARNAVPTLKGGSAFGIPSPPAIVMPARPDANARIVTPDIRDAERLQGFPEDWTEPANVSGSHRGGARWKLVGNAVSVPVFEWVGMRLKSPKTYRAQDDVPKQSRSWPSAAWSMDGEVIVAAVSEWPKQLPAKPLHAFLEFDGQPLSFRATRGFYSRAQKSSLRFPDGFLPAVKAHLARMESHE